MNRIAIIGLGRFGMSLARHLAASGAHVIAIDRNANLVNEIKDEVDLTVRLDSTDQAALTSQEIHKVDVLVVAIGENFEAALLTTVIAKKLGVPRIICRAQTQFHEEIFRQIGAHEVIQPEAQAGEHLARTLAHPHIEDFIELGDGVTLLELRAPATFVGKTLQDLALRTRYGVNLVAIKRIESLTRDGTVVEEQRVLSVPRADDVIQPGDVLDIVGSDEALARLPKE